MTTGRLPAAPDVQRLFDAKAATWPEKYGPGGPLVGRLASISSAVGRYAPADGRVLDLGCGTGELARALASAGLDVTGCDISAEMLRRAASQQGRCAGWLRLAPSWRTLPFASASFDAVVAASVLEYVSDPVDVLAECARVTRPGGVVLYTVPDLRHPVRWAEWFGQALALMPAAGSWPRWHRYRVYLRVSRQRHRLRWWLAASAMAACARRAARIARRGPRSGCSFSAATAATGTEVVSLDRHAASRRHGPAPFLLLPRLIRDDHAGLRADARSGEEVTL